jgi:3-phenylpropionate/trans-cinnamate dioxygenase ferredoxin component
MSMSADYEKAASRDEIAAGGRKSIVVDDLPALLIRVGDAYYCIEDTCTHDGQAMTNGALDGCVITCPRHGAQFDIRTGAALCMPATEPVKTFAVDVRDDGVYVRPTD